MALDVGGEVGDMAKADWQAIVQAQGTLKDQDNNRHYQKEIAKVFTVQN